jgi:hypothetical protein
MKSAIQFKPTTRSLLITLALVCLWVLPGARAVVPPPDGGYPGFNTAEGQNALLNLNVNGGLANTAVGWFALSSNIDNDFNTAVGAGALLFNQESSNTAVGTAALLFNDQGSGNTAVGTATLVNNSNGNSNSAFGAFALNNNVDGAANTAVGFQALMTNSGGNGNTAIGADTLFHNTGSENTAVGDSALVFNTAGFDNTATGSSALFSNTNGLANTASGASALFSNTGGQGNSAVGNHALFSNTTANNNTAVGNSALSANSTGAGNTAIGGIALANNTTGSGNIALGNNAGANVTTATSVTCIGAVGANVDNSCFIARIFGSTSSSGIAVFVNSDGKLGTSTSSRRFKEAIQPMGQSSEALFALDPVTFRYRNEIDPAGMPQFGLVAEDVEKVNPDLIVRDKEGKPYSVRYDQVNAMLLNEFLKEHKRVQEQQAQITALNSRVVTREAINAQEKQEFHATIARQDNEIRTLIATVKEQAAQIQKVSAQLEVGKGDVQMLCLRGVASREVEQNP